MPTNPRAITILKRHGSINFGLAAPVGGGGEKKLQIIVDEELFPGCFANFGYMPQSPPLTLPSYIKLFGEDRTSIHLWHEAAQRLAEADILVILGYSMPDSDTLSRFLISFCTSGPDGGTL